TSLYVGNRVYCRMWWFDTVSGVGRYCGDTMEMLATVLLYTLIGIAAYLLGCWIGKN
ncbi:hypothetical protein LCGC14_2782490, partial [marine sediment metagenome]